MNEVWQKTADRMRDTLGQVSYETWIGPLSFVAITMPPWPGMEEAAPVAGPWAPTVPAGV